DGKPMTEYQNLYVQRTIMVLEMVIRRRRLLGWDIIYHYLIARFLAPWLIIGVFLILYGIFYPLELNYKIMTLIIGITITIGTLFAIKKWFQAEG
ncbi:MAG: hypothetical protein JSV56_08520, partial [Methanomassiliicoccales archaeon]